MLGLSARRENLRRDINIIVGSAVLNFRGISFNVSVDGEINAQEIQRLIDARNTARRAKDFRETDRIRDELEAKGIILKDNSDGTMNWEVKR